MFSVNIFHCPKIKKNKHYEREREMGRKKRKNVKDKKHIFSFLSQQFQSSIGIMKRKCIYHLFSFLIPSQQPLKPFMTIYALQPVYFYHPHSNIHYIQPPTPIHPYTNLFIYSCSTLSPKRPLSLFFFTILFLTLSAYTFSPLKDVLWMLYNFPFISTFIIHIVVISCLTVQSMFCVCVCVYRCVWCILALRVFFGRSGAEH